MIANFTGVSALKTEVHDHSSHIVTKVPLFTLGKLFVHKSNMYVVLYSFGNSTLLFQCYVKIPQICVVIMYRKLQTYAWMYIMIARHVN